MLESVQKPLGNKQRLISRFLTVATKKERKSLNRKIQNIKNKKTDSWGEIIKNENPKRCASYPWSVWAGGKHETQRVNFHRRIIQRKLHCVEQILYINVFTMSNKSCPIIIGWMRHPSKPFSPIASNIPGIGFYKDCAWTSHPKHPLFSVGIN